MTAIDRREVLRVLLGGAVVATVGLAMLPDAAESAPLTISKSLPASTKTPVEEAVVVVRHRRHWGGRRHWVGHRHWVGRRHRRRWVCWWHRGRRICGWRWF